MKKTRYSKSGRVVHPSVDTLKRKRELEEALLAKEVKEAYASGRSSPLRATVQARASAESLAAGMVEDETEEQRRERKALQEALKKANPEELSYSSRTGDSKALRYDKSFDRGLKEFGAKNKWE